MENQDKRQELIDAFADYAIEHCARMLRESMKVNTTTHEEMKSVYVSGVSISVDIADREGDNWKHKTEWESLFLDMVAEFYKRLNKRNKEI